MQNKFVYGVLLLICVACNSKNENAEIIDTPTSGRIKIAVDETFRPIIDAELIVFQGIYADAFIDPIYLPENKLAEQMMNDSVRLIISSKRLSEEEIKFYNSKKLYPKDIAIAKDAIAVITNNENVDSILSIEQIRQILCGKYRTWKSLNTASDLGDIEVVFDNKNSSTVRYVIDSICRGKKITNTVNALNNNIDVIDYVSKHKASIGFIGVGWISDCDDTTQLSFLQKIRVVSVSKEKIATYENSYQPYQAYIFKGWYPFTRTMYAISVDPKNGLPSGFVSFLGGDKGQRIILKSGIVPVVAPTRVINTRENY